MKRTTILSAVAAAALIAAAVQTTAVQAGGENTILPAGAVEWSPGPGSIPPGAEAAVLYGNPSEDGLFALRLKLPDGYHIAPHTHPQPEVVTVISGTFRLGMGETADPAKAQALQPGSFFAMKPGHPHYAYAEGETVIQLNSTGPWALNYVDPADDPRKTQ